MKKFVTRSILFFVIIATCLLSWEMYNLLTNNYKNQLDLNSVRTYHSIDKSKQKKKVKKLLIGDSVAAQLYGNTDYNDSIYSLACNQAITLAGQYFLLHNFIEINKDSLPDEVIFFCNPNSLRNNLDRLTFQYFLKPFYNDEYKPFIDSVLNERIKTIPLHFISQFPLIKTSSYTPEIAVPKNDYFDGIFSPITKDYLKKIESLCKNNGIKFRFAPTPVKKSIIQTIKQFKIDYPIDTLTVDNYFKDIRAFDDTLFVDDSHFKPEYVPKDYLKLN
jgi:hypothetical protein